MKIILLALALLFVVLVRVLDDPDDDRRGCVQQTSAAWLNCAPIGHAIR
jgi:hypothetical protein